MRFFAIFFSVPAALALNGCVGETSIDRVNPPPPYYAYCVVDTKLQDVQERIEDLASPYFQVMTHADVRAQKLQAQAINVSLKCDRGLQGTGATARIESFGEHKLLTEITVQRGFFYGGLEGALKGCLARLGPELKAFSEKAHNPEPAAPTP